MFGRILTFFFFLRESLEASLRSEGASLRKETSLRADGGVTEGGDGEGGSGRAEGGGGCFGVAAWGGGLDEPAVRRGGGDDWNVGFGTGAGVGSGGFEVGSAGFDGGGFGGARASSSSSARMDSARRRSESSWETMSRWRKTAGATEILSAARLER